MNITKEQLDPWLIGSLNCSGVVFSPAEISPALKSYRQVLANGHYHLPFFLSFDIYTLLTKGYEVRFGSEQKSASEVEQEEHFDRKLIMRYERECLGRLLNSTDINAAIEIATTSLDQPIVVERLLLQVLKSIAPLFPKKYQLNPGLIRDYTPEDPLDISQYDAAELFPLIEEFLGNINAQISWDHLLFEEDLFELAHLDALPTDHLRVGCRQILAVSRQLRSPEPPTLDLSSHEDGADTAFLDETHYPTGGLSGLTNRGSFENLLTSELVYLDEGTKDVSLFELRYAEGELLYYLRDSGNLRRKRRSIHFVLDVGSIFEAKLPGYQWQYSVLLQGFCLRLLHDLFEIFEMDALRFHFHYIKSDKFSFEEQEFFDGEIGVMKTVLSDYVKHEWVTFESVQDIELEQLIDSKRKSYAVVLAAPNRLEKWQTEVNEAEAAELAIHCALISVDQKAESELSKTIELPRGGLELVEIQKRKDAVLEKLVS